MSENLKIHSDSNLKRRSSNLLWWLIDLVDLLVDNLPYRKFDDVALNGLCSHCHQESEIRRTKMHELRTVSSRSVTLLP